MSAEGEARRCALVTGASQGIGRAAAVALAQEGHNVIVHCNRNARAAEETAAKVGAAGVRSWVLSADLGSDSGATDLIGRALASSGRIDVLVNNAAALWLGEADAIPAGELRTIFAVNCEAPYRLMAEGAKAMRRDGRIINISSDAARLPRARVAAYAASKAALESLTLSFAEWLGPRGITVNAIAPGPVRTEMMEPWLRDRSIEEAVSRTSAQHRVALTSDIVPIVLFLARAESGWINGQTIEATGGRVAAW
jgi:3-oxoacyl-[acyl-carrier protein] reductase